MNAWLMGIFMACGATTSALAFCPAPAPKACAAYFESDQVFVGKVLEVRQTGRPDDVGRTHFTLEVGEVLLGTAAKVERVSTENSSGRWIGEPGNTYVVFARKGSVGGHCSSIDEPEQVQETMRSIRALKDARDVTIEGEAVAGGGGPGAAGVAGTKVRVRSTRGASYSTVTDGHGSFILRVPPGTYSVRADAFVPSVYGRHDAARFTVVAGQCAQFQFSRLP
jgi:hypothetical protein